jgi:hypothetical protein
MEAGSERQLRSCGRTIVIRDSTGAAAAAMRLTDGFFSKCTPVATPDWRKS